MKTLGFQFKRLLKVTSLTVTFAIRPLTGLALDIKDIPNPRQINGTWVTDMAEILSDETESQLNQMISQLELQNGSEIAVVTVPETSPSATPKEFATTLFNYWHIGKADQDNGVLFLISKGDRRVEIETGYGIEPILPNTQVSTIIETQITPRFKQGDFDGGTLAGTKALVVVLESPQTSNTTTQTLLLHQSSTFAEESTEETYFPWQGLFIIGLLVWLITPKSKPKRSNSPNRDSSDSSNIINFESSYSNCSSDNCGDSGISFSSSDSGGDSGSSCGGGDSGGGGDGGSW